MGLIDLSDAKKDLADAKMKGSLLHVTLLLESASDLQKLMETFELNLKKRVGGSSWDCFALYDKCLNSRDHSPLFELAEREDFDISGPIVEAKPDSNICKFFQRGECRNGARCRFSHKR